MNNDKGFQIWKCIVTFVLIKEQGRYFLLTSLFIFWAMVISNSLAKKRMQFLLLLIRQERDTVSYFNTWNLYGLKGEYGNVWKLPSRVSLVRASVFFFWARIPSKRLPARQSLVRRVFGLFDRCYAGY